MTSPEVPRHHSRKEFEEFARRILAVPKAELDARLAAERRRKRKKPPLTN